MHDLIPLFDDQSHSLVNEVLRGALCCPDCGARYYALVAMTENITIAPRYVLTCSECKYLGPFGRGLQDAVDRWNKPAGFIAKLIRKWKWKHGDRKPQWRIHPPKKQWVSQ